MSDDERQKVLFSGMDCLPGQMDLFPTDGYLSDEEGDDDVRVS